MNPTIPASCFVDDSAQIIGDVVLGEHASVWMNAVVRGDVHEIRVGAYSNVQDNSVLHGMKQQWGVYLGEYVTVGHSVTLHGCVIEDRCLIGMGSIILNGARIGAGSIIAAGTLIPEKTMVEPGSLWMGSPGKFRRKLGPAEDEMILRYARNYLGYKDEYLKESRQPSAVRKNLDVAVKVDGIADSRELKVWSLMIKAVRGTRDLLPPDTALW